MPSKSKTKAASEKKAVKKAVVKKAPPPPAPPPATDATDWEIAGLWKKVSLLDRRIAGQRKHLIDLASVAFRLDAFIDAIRPTLPSSATDEADALKAAVKELST